jgi:hypothetical protein
MSHDILTEHSQQKITVLIFAIAMPKGYFLMRS